MSQEQSENLSNEQEPDEQQLESYIIVKTLGKGNFGKVKLGIHKITNQFVAIKILQKDLIFEKTDIERISRQIKIMKLVRHPNIIQLYQIIETQKRLYLIMEFAEGGDLFDLIVKSEKIKEQQACQYYSSIMMGIQYLHSKGVTHRDLKPQNILLSFGQIKIGDFGLGNFFTQGENLKTACGSPCYASPEMLQKNPYNPQKIDIWSSGIILYAMICGYLPFEDQNTNRLYEKIKNNQVKFPRSLSQQMKGLIKRILQKSPEERVGIQNLKQDPLLKGNFEKLKEKQFEVEIDKVKRICELYGIEEQEDKLVNYLKKNKHNNLTTLYYLAVKKEFKEKQVQRNVEQIHKQQKVNQISFKNLVDSSDNSSDKEHQSEAVSNFKKEESESQKQKQQQEITKEGHVDQGKDQEKQVQIGQKEEIQIEKEENIVKEDEKEKQKQKENVNSQKSSIKIQFIQEVSQNQNELQSIITQTQVQPIKIKENENVKKQLLSTPPKYIKNKIVQKHDKITEIKKKSKLIKNERMPIVSASNNKEKSVKLYERSSSKDRPLKVKKVIGKNITAQPYLINPNYLVGCSWEKFNKHLLNLGGEGRIEYYKFNKDYIYIAKSSVRGVGNLVNLIQKINESL